MSITFAKKILSTRSVLINQRRYGYVVLVPEIGDELPNQNPLLGPDGLPEFNNLTIENCVNTVGRQVYEMEKGVQNLEAELAKNENIDIINKIIKPLQQSDSPLETTWGIAKTMYLGNSSLMPTKNYLQINDRARRAKCSKFFSRPIFEHVVRSRNRTDLGLGEVECRLLDKFALEGKLNGVNLDEKKKEILTYNLNKLHQEKKMYDAKVEYATKKFTHTINDYGAVKEFPSDLLQEISTNSVNQSKGPWKVTLQQPTCEKFMENCDNRTLRWNVWQADTQRASAFSERHTSNSIHIEQIRSYRKDMAEVLGYENYVAMSMETKMAGNVTNVQNMISDLLSAARPAQENELQKLAEFAAANGCQQSFEMYDIPYWKLRQFKSLTGYHEDVIREYFPINKVLSGLFQLTEKLFQIKIVERPSASVWHEDVKFYDIFDQNSGTKPLAGFYLDLYSRENDKARMLPTSGWMVGIRNPGESADICPLASLIFNFQVPLYGKPSLLSFFDVQTLFRTFGQSLQHLLTEVKYKEMAGLSNVEWDVVDVSGLVMSHMVLHGDTLKSISGHYANEQPLPDNLINALHMKQKHMSGFTLCRELYFATLDLELNLKTNYWNDIVKELWPQFCLIPLGKKDSHLCSFSQIVSGQWAAAYYSHIWSQMLAADIYSSFHEVGKDEQKMEVVGKRFRDTYLALGGSVNPHEVFRKFRGRDPSTKALLKTLGLNSTSTPAENQ